MVWYFDLVWLYNHASERLRNLLMVFLLHKGFSLCYNAIFVLLNSKFDNGKQLLLW